MTDWVAVANKQFSLSSSLPFSTVSSCFSIDPFSPIMFCLSHFSILVLRFQPQVSENVKWDEDCITHTVSILTDHWLLHLCLVSLKPRGGREQRSFASACDGEWQGNSPRGYPAYYSHIQFSHDLSLVSFPSQQGEYLLSN